MNIHEAGDWYGGVRYVGKTHVATWFFPVELFPFFPLRSAYLRPPDAGDPEWVCTPLAHLDWPSVTCAYIRGVAGALAFVGTIAFLFGFIFWLTDSRSDPPPVVFLAVGGAMAGIGVLAGAISYLVWRIPNRRERWIREIAGTHMSLAVDPALITIPEADVLITRMERQMAQEGIADYRKVIERSHEYSSPILELVLLRVRAEMAVAGNDPINEDHVNLLLRSLGERSRT